MEDARSGVPPVHKPAPAVNQAFQIAREKLLRVSDVAAMCRNSGAVLHDALVSATITLVYCNQTYIVSLRDADIFPSGDVAALSPREKLLILHYLLTARGTPQSGKLVTFQELPEGRVYYPTHVKRGVQPLVAKFGANPDILLSAASRLGGKPAGFGDVSVTISAFPRVPVTIVLWKGDSEFEAGGNILFDDGISNYLPTEDITVLCETMAWKLVKSS